MTVSVRVIDELGERIYQPHDFPLSIGAGSEVAIALPGMTEDGVYGYLVLSDEALFFQPENRLPVYKNKELIKESSWLYEGDTIHVGDAAICCTFDDQIPTLSLRTIDHNNHPPVIVPPKVPLRSDSFAQARPKPATQPTSKSRSRALKAILSSVFFCLLLLAIYVFTARSVSIQISPEPDDFGVSGGLFRFKVADRYLLRPGNYIIKAEKVGYQPLQEIAEVSNETSQAMVFSMKPLPGKLIMQIEPPLEAEITIDGKVVEGIPKDGYALPAGTHDIHVQAPRYLPFVSKVVIAGAGQKQNLAVNLVPAWAVISVASDPAGAMILIDGQEKGLTPLTLDILNGPHQLLVTMEGHETWQTNLTVVANEAQSISDIVLRKADGKISVTSRPTSASVSVDGAYQGLTPLDISVTSSKSHTVVLSKAGHEPATRSFKVEAAGKRKLSFTLIPKRGTLVLNIRPADAQLYIDGKARKTAEGRIKLSAVRHKLEIRKKGYESFTKTVTPRAGFPQEIEVELIQTTQKAKLRTVAKLIKTKGGQQLRYITPGKFTMGASRREQGRRANETAYTVNLTRPFYLGVKEVTNAQFRRFKASHSSGRVQRFTLDEDNLPAVQVSWEDAAQYCNWLSERESLPPVYVTKGVIIIARDPIPTGYRLPTEAEWAWVARAAGKKTALKYPWGMSFPPSGAAGNYADASAASLIGGALPGYSDSYPGAAPVGSFKPNNLGLFDLGGNAAEWVHDYYVIHSSATTHSLQDPSGPDTGTHHTVRGSSWRQGSISELRLSYRDYSRAKRQDLGFRIARYADQLTSK